MSGRPDDRTHGQDEDGQHRTQQVPWPLPPVEPAQEGHHRTEQVPWPPPAPPARASDETGKLYLDREEYPPRVPPQERPDGDGADGSVADGDTDDPGTGRGR